MKIYQSQSFAKKAKKLTGPEKHVLDNEIMGIVQDPAIGEEKKGDLRGVFVHKFNLHNQLYLLAYCICGEECIELIMLGPLENYYRDLKVYLRNR